MKNSALALTALLLASKSLLGFVELDRGELFLETQFLVMHDGNITGNIFKESDTIFSVDPTLKYQRKMRGNLEAGIGMNFVRFNDFNQFDSEDLHGNFNVDFPVATGSPMSGGVSVTYMEATQVDQYVNDRVSSETTNIGLNGRYRVRDRVSVRGNVRMLDRNTSRYSNIDDKSASVGVVIGDIWQDVGLTVDYRKRTQKTTGEIAIERDDNDDSFSVGLEGQILPAHLFPKLEAFASFSLQKVDASRSGGAEDKELIGFDGKLVWEARPTTNVSLTFNRDLALTINDSLVEFKSYAIQIQQQFSRVISGTVGLQWRDVTYIEEGRADERFGINGSLVWILGRNWSAGVQASYDEGDSTRFLNNFDRFQAGLFSVFRF